ncbi:MAG: peptide-methionine (R)-S-oxide reductase MsrB [Pseudomonadota bacterium]
MGDKQKIHKTEEQWRKELTSEQFYICRQKGTEPAFSGEFNGHKGSGTYVCVACKTPLFDSDHKFDSGSGWPSFFQPTNIECIQEEFDESHGMRRTEVMCKACGAHLGHVFEDGPQPTGLRYCINSISLGFDSKGDS